VTAVHADRIGETFNTAGTGPISLLGPRPGYRGVAGTFVDGEIRAFLLHDPSTQDWEVSECTIAGSGVTLNRTTFLASSTGSPISFAAGPKTATHVVPASYFNAMPYFSDTPPANPRFHPLWWNTTIGNLFVYYDDGDTQQWVSAAAGIEGVPGIAKGFGRFAAFA
jgi:hypothetical protein